MSLLFLFGMISGILIINAVLPKTEEVKSDCPLHKWIEDEHGNLHCSKCAKTPSSVIE